MVDVIQRKYLTEGECDTVLWGLRVLAHYVKNVVENRTDLYTRNEELRAYDVAVNVVEQERRERESRISQDASAHG